MHLKQVVLHPERYPTREFYPFHLPVFDRMEPISLSSQVTFFVGENGTGKSSLLEAIAHACGIHIWEDVERIRATCNPYEKKLPNYLSIEWTDRPVPGSFFGASIFRQFTTMLDEWASTDPGLLSYFGGESLMTKSHGQSLMAFFRNRYQLKGLHLLDEPETALSPRSQLELLDLLSQARDTKKAQFIIATHSPLLMAYPDAVIYSFDGSLIKPVTYEETTHYQVYKRFMDNPENYLTPSDSRISAPPVATEI